MSIDIENAKLKTIWLILKGIGARSHGYAIHKKTNISLKYIYTILPKLINAGLVTEADFDTREGRKYFSLTEEGKTLLNILDNILNVRPIRYVIFDLDGVIFSKVGENPSDDKVSMSTWDLIFIRIGAYDVHEKLKEEFKKGQFNYNEWTKKACDELKRRGLRKHMFDEVIKFREYTPGAKEVIKTLLENDVKVGIISGSFYELGERVIKDFELENELKQKKIVIHAHCMLEFDPDSGELIRPHIEATDYEDKASLLEVFTKIFNVSPEEIAYIGDDVNDIPIMRKVGLPIAFNTHKPSVIKAAKIVINKNDLREVLPYLGIKKELKLNQLKLTEHLIKS